jgi:hypothetical protein
MTVQRVGRPDTVWRASWIVAGNPAGSRKALISDRPWESTTNDCALLIAMLTLGVGFSAVWINRRRRRRFTDESEQARQSQKRTPVRL